MGQQYYLCFSINKLPDLTLTKYSVYDGSSVENIMDKHAVFLRQLHRLGYTAGVYFHLLYYYNPQKHIPKGRHLLILFYATSTSREKLEGIREFLTTSVLSTYYDFFCYEVAESFSIEEEMQPDGHPLALLNMTTISGVEKKYGLGRTSPDQIVQAQAEIAAGERSHIVCEIASDGDVILNFNQRPVDRNGRVVVDKTFSHGAFLTKKDYSLPAQNTFDTDPHEVNLYAVMEWEPCESGRLYNVLKLMEGYDRHAVLRIDIFPVEHTQDIRKQLPYADLRKRVTDRVRGKDENSDAIVKAWDKYLNNLMKYPQFLANVVAFADSKDIAVMLVDSVAAEAVESGTYRIEDIHSDKGFGMYESDSQLLLLRAKKEPDNYVAPLLSLYTLKEIRPMFSFPILYPGETVECHKETDPIPFPKEMTIDPQTRECHEVISLGVSDMGYDVTFPLKLFKKHAFIAGVPGAGKTNTMLYLVTTLWRDTNQHVPFLVLEPAKQEYRALAMIPGMEALCVFSPGADTRFPLHINPFEFPEGLTLAEHIANLNAVFAGAFELIPPSPFLIDKCIEKVYLDKGWNINERNTGAHAYPTMQELYDSLRIAVEESGYEGESKSNIRSVMEVRIGSLLRREIGNVYNVRHSSLKPEEWLMCPVIIELEALGEGPANFMSLLISTLIREVLKIRKTSELSKPQGNALRREIEHIIFYEEAHNLIGPTTDNPPGGSVDPKISATKYLVKMLAEVRALGEGIVIADQLPTAMAPEVLKNTGLKLGHRITAQDDRNLLGSTMSASAEQLEEQGTFGTGQALIFYENLMKPYKMRICEWEKNLPQTKYDSPSNMQLFAHLKDNPIYNGLLRKSAQIMQEKMRSDFELLHRQGEQLKKRIKRKQAELQKAMMHPEKQRQNWDTLLGEDKTELRNAEMESVQARVCRELNVTLARELTTLCWGYSNQFYAYMTLSQNYHVYSDEMYLGTINQYLTLFEKINELQELPELNGVLWEHTRPVLEQIEQFVDWRRLREHTRFSGYLLGYGQLLCKLGSYIRMLLNDRYGQTCAAAAAFAQAQTWDMASFSSFCREWNRQVLEDSGSAEHYCAVVADHCERLQILLEEHLQEGTKDYERVREQLQYCQSILHTPYKALASGVIDVFRAFGGLKGEPRRTLLKETKEAQDALRRLVDHRDLSAPTLLSQWSGYYPLWRGARVIAYLMMGAQFDYFHCLRIEHLDPREKDRIDMGYFKTLCENYNGLFSLYRPKEQDTAEYRYTFVQHYCRLLYDAMEIGPVTYPVLWRYVRLYWEECMHIIEGIAQEPFVRQEDRVRWSRLLDRMTRAMRSVA